MTKHEFNPRADMLESERTRRINQWCERFFYSAVELGIMILFATMILTGMNGVADGKVETFFEIYVTATLMFILAYFIYQIFRRTTSPGQLALAPIAVGVIGDNMGFFTIAAIIWLGFSLMDLYVKLKIWKEDS